MGWSVFRCLQRRLLCHRLSVARLAKATSRKTVHMIALVCGGIGLISVFFITNKWLLFGAWPGSGLRGRRFCRCLT